jgi:hypothetical protein
LPSLPYFLLGRYQLYSGVFLYHSGTSFTAGLGGKKSNPSTLVNVISFAITVPLVYFILYVKYYLTSETSLHQLLMVGEHL